MCRVTLDNDDNDDVNENVYDDNDDVNEDVYDDNDDVDEDVYDDNDQFVHLWFEVLSPSENLADKEKFPWHGPRNQLAHHLEKVEGEWCFRKRLGITDDPD